MFDFKVTIIYPSASENVNFSFLLSNIPANGVMVYLTVTVNAMEILLQIMGFYITKQSTYR